MTTSTDTAREAAEQAWQDLLDKDDRTSPAEYPDMALITRDEFVAALLQASRAGAEAMRTGINAQLSGLRVYRAAPDVRAIQIEEPK